MKKEVMSLFIVIMFLGVVSAWSVDIDSPVQDSQHGNLVTNITYTISDIDASNLSSICWEDNVSSYCDYSSLQLTDTLDISSVQGDNLVVLNVTLNTNESKIAKVDFWVDSVYPDIAWVVPNTNPIAWASDTINLEISYTETNPESIEFEIYDSLNQKKYSLFDSIIPFVTSTSKGSLNDDEYMCYVTIFDTIGHSTTINTTVFIDNVNPYYSNIQTQADNVYSEEKNYTFSIQWDDDLSGVDSSSVVFELEGNSYSVANIGNIYYATVDNLAAGDYNYTWTADDNAGNSNTTGNLSYTVVKATPVLSLDASPSWNENYSTETNVSGNGCPSQLICNLYRDGIAASEPKILGAGSYIYVYNTSGNQNYTVASVNGTLVINPISPEDGMNLTGTSPIVYGNASDFQGTETNAGDSDCVYELYANGNNVTNPDNKIYGVGTIDYVYNTSGCTNYTAGSVSGSLEITKAAQDAELNISPDTNVTYGTAITAVCNGTLYRDGDDVSGENGTAVVLGAGIYNYSCVLEENANYSGDEESEIVNINKNYSITELYLNSSRSNITLEQGSNYTNISVIGNSIGDVNASVYIDGIPLLNNYYDFLLGGLYNVTAQHPETENYTSSYETWWVNVSDTITPEIEILSPVFNTTYTTNILDLNVTTNEDGCSWKYSIDEGLNNNSFIPNTTISFSNGDYNLYVWVSDGSGNENVSNVSFTVNKQTKTSSRSGSGSCRTIWNCTLWGAWSACENKQQNRTCLSWEKVKCKQGIKKEDLEAGEIRNCTIEEPVRETMVGEPIVVNPQEEIPEEPGLITRITGGMIGFAQSGTGIVTIATILILAAALGVIHYKRKFS